ncbi:hypothetical protein GPX89_33200 [Nocardia sp. ET3-3]|uniref:Uncharacterized protein n=1 Tax=Nocardia terrae TaxID=2675851 RepID=A0A7K1V603_9NOCA|nr:hypothetical protein [Nocardia terrae]MVU82083.1 hypothetical protein [Nocardia terrae]
MAVVNPTDTERSPSVATVDIAGTAWPVYKLEALFAGVVVCLMLALITGSIQLAVLGASTVAALRWLLGMTRR